MEKALYTLLGPQGRFFGVKWAYREEHPHHLVFFNAYIYVDGKKMWCGDFNLTTDEEVLVKLSSLYPTKEISVFPEDHFTDFSSKAPNLEKKLYSIKSGEVLFVRPDFIKQKGKLYEYSVASK